MPRAGRPPFPQGDDGMVEGCGGTAGLYMPPFSTLQLLVNLSGDTGSMAITSAPQRADHVAVASESERDGEVIASSDSWVPPVDVWQADRYASSAGLRYSSAISVMPSGPSWTQILGPALLLLAGYDEGRHHAATATMNLAAALVLAGSGLGYTARSW